MEVYKWSIWESFSNYLKFNVGDGTIVRFWKNIWCGDHSFKHLFPDFLSFRYG